MTNSTAETVRYRTTQKPAEKSVRITARWTWRSTVLAVLAAVVVVDQVTKFWAWRHVSGAIINYGGDALVGPEIGEWYADPIRGALLDLFDVGVLCVAVFVLVRRRRPGVVLGPGAVVIGGWGSNLLDRLGLHYWTAPDSVRGAVDFIHFGKSFYNVADVFIVVGTPLLLVAGAVDLLGLRAPEWPAPTGSAAPTRRAWISALAGAGALVVIVWMGAVNYGGVDAPAPAPASGPVVDLVTANGAAGE